VNNTKRPFIASISGKGGSGKTTLTALLLKVLLERSSNDSILVVDADPATNLPDVLGLETKRTLGEVIEDFRKKVNEPSFAVGVRKDSVLEYWIIRDCLIEAEKFDLLPMGRGEGEGCYCYVNSILVGILGKLLRNYDVVLMDMEAGLEHLNRRTDRYVNTMLIVVDPSRMGFRTAERILEVIDEVDIRVDKIYVVGNRFPVSMIEGLYEWADRRGCKVAGVIPEDKLLLEYSINGTSLLNLPSNAPSVEAARLIARKIALID